IGRVQTFGEKRAFRRTISRLCRSGVRSSDAKSLRLLGVIANKFTRRFRGFGQGGGESGIRTHGTVSRTHAFQACALSHSAISPDRPLLERHERFCKRMPRPIAKIWLIYGIIDIFSGQHAPGSIHWLAASEP